MQPGLSQLIYPHSMTEFLKVYASGQPLVVHDLANQMSSIFQLPFLNSVEDLIRIWPDKIQAHLPDVRDEVSSIDTNSKDAFKLYQNGMGLLFNEAHHLSPMLMETVEKIRKDLGLSAHTYSRCLIYATPDGKGTAPHFDQNINFVLQIKGVKKWKLAPNEHVINPLTRHTIGQPTDPEIQSYENAPMPLKMPKDCESVELRPGSMLYVPRGYWHSTEASGDALALNFTFTAPTWIDIFLAALRSRLALSPEWRETADGVSDPFRRDEAEEKFDYLLSTLKDDLPHWQAASILAATEPEE